MQVIGTGFGRTGTDSMRIALDILGFGPCHHMRALLADEEMKMNWRRLAMGQSPGWDVLFGHYKSCVDWPSAHYWPQLIRAFPDAKVLLTWRSAESWWTSFEKTILPLLLNDPETEETAPGSQLLAQRVFGGKPMTRAHCIARYTANVAQVKATVPADRLLIHKIGDGWGPLCHHLGVPIPDIPFPSANSAAAFQSELGETPANSS